MSEAPLIVVEGVSKRFCRDLKRSLWYGICDVASEFAPSRSSAAPRLRPDEFWAVDDVAFELRRGECLGLIGRNGAGKTTLLKMLNGLIKPDKGRIEMRGRVGALIALGAGFNPVLTGRENIYVNGAVLGLQKMEIDAKIDEIIDFAEIGEFIDAPVQSYSSGMQVRLGFAVATTLQSDILILDEVLAVGDAAFRAKCYNKIGQLQKNAAVIFVSHSMDQIARISSSVLLMSKGRQSYRGDPPEGIAAYERENAESQNGGSSFIIFTDPVKGGRVAFREDAIDWNGPLELTIEVDSNSVIERPVIYGVLYDLTGMMAASFVAKGNQVDRLEPGINQMVLQIDHVPLVSGKYRLGLAVNTQNSSIQLLWSYKQISIQVQSSPVGVGSCLLRARIQLCG